MCVFSLSPEQMKHHCVRSRSDIAKGSGPYNRDAGRPSATDDDRCVLYGRTLSVLRPGESSAERSQTESEHPSAVAAISEQFEWRCAALR